MVYSGAWGKLIHEKYLKSKISWLCPFKFILLVKRLDAFKVNLGFAV
jgi:hypothetical protein